MKKTLFIILLSLLASLATKAQMYTYDPSGLRVDSVCLQGNMMDMMTQRVYASVLNTSDSIYKGYISISRADNSLFFEILPGQRVKGCWTFRLPQGEHTLHFYGSFYDSNNKVNDIPLGKDIHVSIGSLRKLNFEVDYDFDMMTDEGNDLFLIGRRLQGKLSVINVDSVPYYGGWGLEKYGTEVSYHLKNEDNAILAYDYIPGNKTFEPGDTISTTLGINYYFEDGKRYTLEVLYRAPGHDETIDSLQFTFLAGMSTIWTANGKMKPLGNIDIGKTSFWNMKVPSEAVAVDLCGLHFDRSMDSIDVSQANPNCLYYLDSVGNQPEGLTPTCNVVIGGQAPVIRLMDNYDYYCPRPFWSEYVSYTLQPNNVAPGYGPYAETIVLPFDPQGAFFNDINSDDADLHKELLKVLHFKHLWYDYSKLELEEIAVDEMHAYNAYIVAVAIKTPVTFYAETAYMWATPSLNIGDKGTFYLTGSTLFRAPTTLTYRYHPETGTFNRQYTDEQLPPFRAWICEGDYVLEEGEIYFGLDEDTTETLPSSEYESLSDVLYMDISFDISDAEHQGIAECMAPDDTSAKVYSLDGMQRNSGRLPKGLYIVGGKKIMVK